jgi:hypothetical protein
MPWKIRQKTLLPVFAKAFVTIFHFAKEETTNSGRVIGGYISGGGCKPVPQVRHTLTEIHLQHVDEKWGRLLVQARVLEEDRGRCQTKDSEVQHKL